MKVKNVFTYFTDTILRRNANSYRNPRVRWAVRQYKLLFYTARRPDRPTIRSCAAPP